jgi:hypothetical protein
MNSPLTPLLRREGIHGPNYANIYMLPLLLAREGGRGDEFLSFINMGSVRRLTKYDYAATEELGNFK